NIHGILGAMVLYLILIGCDKDNTDPGIIVDIDPTFEIQMIENLEGASGSLAFIVSTIDEKECLNLELTYSLSQTTSGFGISLDELEEPEDCITGTTFVTETIPLEPLQNRVYNAEINLKNTIKNQGVLLVNEAYYEMQLESYNGILFQTKKLYKVPKSALWGSLRYNSEDLQPIAQQFISDLETLAEARSMAIGNYGHFNIDSQGLIWFSGEGEGNSLGADFIYHYDSADIQPLIDLINDYRIQYSPNLDINMYNGRGLTF
ncbi:MAG: hypothetical protein AAGH79_13005, partial [Bacteroidota bacterium]